MSSQSASSAKNASEKQDSRQFVGFQLAGQDYAFRIEQIQEIVIPESVTTIPQVPDFVEGVRNLRGAIIPVINLRRLLGLESVAPDAETRTIVVNVGLRTVGCTVDRVSQVLRIPLERIQPAPDTIAGDGAEYLAGFAKLSEQLIVLLDIDELLSIEKLEARGEGPLRLPEPG